MKLQDIIYKIHFESTTSRFTSTILILHWLSKFYNRTFWISHRVQFFLVNRLAHQLWDDDKQDFRNVNSELEDIENSETVYSEEELEEKIEFLYPIYKGINFANSVQIVLNNSTSQVAYLGYDDNSVFETLRCLNVIHAISAEGDCYGYFLKTD